MMLGISYWKFILYLRIRCVKKPLGMYACKTFDPIEKDLLDLDITPTQRGATWYVECQEYGGSLPRELMDLDVNTTKALCQFIIDTVGKKPIYVPEKESVIWLTMFAKINYEIKIMFGQIRFIGLKRTTALC